MQTYVKGLSPLQLHTYVKSTAITKCSLHLDGFMGALVIYLGFDLVCEIWARPTHQSHAHILSADIAETPTHYMGIVGIVCVSAVSWCVIKG